MSAIILIASFISITFNSNAIEYDKTDVHVFGLYTMTKYSKQQTEVYKGKKDLYCKTELSPFHVVENENDYKLAAIKKSLEEIKSSTKPNAKVSDCTRNEVMVISVDKKEYALCLDSPKAVTFRELISKSCGRSL